MEVELLDLVYNIFNRQPKPAKSIQLQFIENLSIQEIFEFLLTFFTEGAKYKYGEDKSDPNTKVDISKWTDSELNNMKEYFASISFILNVKKNTIDTIDANSLISYKDKLINETVPLKELSFSITIGISVFTISFDYLV